MILIGYVAVMVIVAVLAAIVGYLAIRLGAMNAEIRRTKQAIEQVYTQLDRRDIADERARKQGGAV